MLTLAHTVQRGADWTVYGRVADGHVALVDAWDCDDGAAVPLASLTGAEWADCEDAVWEAAGDEYEWEAA